jgi:hypothetical protein
MAVDSVRSGRYLIWRATLVVRVVYLMDWLVVSILEDGKLALVRVETTETVVMRFLG